MKKLILSLFSFALFSSSVFAVTYIPDDTSSEYLPTVKIVSYSLSYDGELVGETYGSGTLISNRGVILTNNHVIEDYFDPASTNDAFQVCLTRSNDTLNPECKYTASIITRDRDNDLALLKIDSTDALGKSVSFDFSLSYKNSAHLDVGDSITAIGYPDTGGRTVTVTSGIVSGFLDVDGVNYFKSDTDISFGNSGGTAVDSDGNFVGVPTLVQISADTLSYLYPVADAVSWIDKNKDNSSTVNEVANSQLRDMISRTERANATGTYQNDYPVYEVSLIDGYEFVSDLDATFESNVYGANNGSSDVVIVPEKLSDASVTFLQVSVIDFAYELSLADLEGVLDNYADQYFFGDEKPVRDQVELNGKYDAFKEVNKEYDWWTGQYKNAVAYYVPYGDKVVSIFYVYTDDQLDSVDDFEEVLESFALDLSEIELSVVSLIRNDDLGITLESPDGMFLSDDGYEYGGVNYFGASLGKKTDPNFSVDIYSSDYVDKEGFVSLKEDTLENALEFYDVVAQGDLVVDGHNGFFFTDEYGSSLESSFFTTLYIENDEDTYFYVFYSAPESDYQEGSKDFEKILRGISFDGGSGAYNIPSFTSESGEVVGGSLRDIRYYAYEDNIRSLDSLDAFDVTPRNFYPANSLARMDYVVWAVRTLSGDQLVDFENFERSYYGCTDDCYADVPTTMRDAVYIYYAREVGAIKDAEMFYADDQISLLEAWKIIFELNDIRVWNAPDFVEWYIPYLYVAFEYDIIPVEVLAEGSMLNHKLTRGEGAFIVDQVYWYFGGEDFF